MKLLNAALWAAQLYIAYYFVWIGYVTFTAPIPVLAARIAWTAQLPQAVVRGLAVLDMAGGIGLVLPLLTDIWLGLTRVAAWCCALLQTCAILFHLTRGEGSHTKMNFAFLAFALFIAWGRGSGRDGRRNPRSGTSAGHATDGAR